MGSCKYCDKIDDAAMNARRELNADAARERLAAKSTEMKDIMEKVKNNEPLSQKEIDELWKVENRTDAITALYKSDKNIMNDVAKNAIKTGDREVIKTTEKEIKKEAIKCARMGLCSAAGMAAAGLVGIATVTSLASATKDMWAYDAENDEFIPVKNANETENTDKSGAIPASIADAYQYLMSTGIADQSKYSMGNQPGVQGREKDKAEYICQNYALDACNALKSAGYDAQAVLLYGMSKDGKEVWHAAIVINDNNKMNYLVDPSSGKLVKQVPTMTLVEPQTGYVGQTGVNFAGTNMKVGNTEYTISHIEIVGKNATQQSTFMPDIQRYGMTLAGEGGISLSETDTESEMAIRQQTLSEQMKTNAWGVAGHEAESNGNNERGLQLNLSEVYTPEAPRIPEEYQNQTQNISMEMLTLKPTLNRGE